MDFFNLKIWCMWAIFLMKNLMHRFNPNMFSTLFFYANSVKLTTKRIQNYLGCSRDTVKCRFSNLGWSPHNTSWPKKFSRNEVKFELYFLKILTVTLLLATLFWHFFPTKNFCILYQEFRWFQLDLLHYNILSVHTMVLIWN